MASVDWADSSPFWQDGISELESKAHKVLAYVDLWRDEAQDLEKAGRSYLKLLKNFAGQVSTRFNEMGLPQAPECLTSVLDEMANCHEVFVYSLHHTFVK